MERTIDINPCDVLVLQLLVVIIPEHVNQIRHLILLGVSSIQITPREGLLSLFAICCSPCTIVMCYKMQFIIWEVSGKWFQPIFVCNIITGSAIRLIMYSRVRKSLVSWRFIHVWHLCFSGLKCLLPRCVHLCAIYKRFLIFDEVNICVSRSTHTLAPHIPEAWSVTTRFNHIGARLTIS